MPTRAPLFAALVVSSTFTAASAQAQPPAASPATDIARLGWMAGCWEQRAGARVTEEQWMAPSGGAMLGMSRTVAGGAMRAWEALRIQTDNGRLAYIAQPNGGSATAFPAMITTDTLAMFENLAHDFPQRIAYRKVSADSVVARISAEKDGRTRGMDIPMKKVRCGG